MKFAVVQFPGSNCDQDSYNTLKYVLNQQVRYVWHKDGTLAEDEIIVLPGGFTFGDYLRCGAIARFSPIMESIKKAAERGQTILGICNGFQILCEAGLLPGALVRNEGLHFICDHIYLRVESNQTVFTQKYQKGDVLKVPITHGEGRYIADEATLESLNKNDQVLVRYCNAQGEITPESNPNGAMQNIAGICNEKRNVFGLMPHPERACEEALGSADALKLFMGMMEGKNV